MKMKYFYLTVLFFYSISSFAAGSDGCPDNLKSVDIYYCGKQINGPNSKGCVKASGTEAAKNLCRARGGTTWRLNNEVYHLNAPSGVFLCSGAPVKAVICKNLGYTWSDPECSYNGFITKSQADHKNGCGDSTKPDVGEKVLDEDKICASKGGTLSRSEGGHVKVCNCDGEGMKSPTVSVQANSTDKCEKAEPVPVQSSEIKPSDSVTQCGEKHLAEVNKCIEQADPALKACKESSAKENSNFKQQSEIINLFAQKIISSKANSGAVAECMGASALGQGVVKLLSSMKNACEDELKKCEDSCEAAKKTFQQACIEASVKPTADLNQGPAPDPDLAYLIDLDKKYQKDAESAVAKCTKMAPVEADLLKEALQAANKSQNDAAICACKLSASGPPPGVPDCSSIPAAAACQAYPQTAGCSGPGIINCALGSSDYALPKCQCLQDPSLSFCPAPAGKVPFAFAGDLKALAPGGGGGVFAGGGGGGDSGMDLGGLSQQDARTDSKLAPQGDAPGIGVNPVSGNSGGGGGSGGDGAGAPTADAGGEPAEKNMGLMGMVKSAVGNMFGSKPGSAANNKTPNKGLPGYDVDKWRPRGLASTGCNVSQIRCKNEDIFSIVNKRYLNNEMSFIQNP